MSLIYKTKKFTDIYDNANDFLNDYKKFDVLKNITDDSTKIAYYLLYARYGNSPIANSDETQFKAKLFSIMFQYGPNWEKELDIQSKLRSLTEDQLMKGAASLLNNQSNSTGTNTGTVTDSGSITDVGTNTVTGSTESSGTSTTTTSSNSTDTTINNHAFNPASSPVAADTPLTYIDEQNYSKKTNQGSQTVNGTNSNESSNSSTNNINDTKTTNNQRTDNLNRTDTSTLTSNRQDTKGILEAYDQLLKLLKDDVSDIFVRKFKVCFKQFVGPEVPLLYDSRY